MASRFRTFSEGRFLMAVFLILIGSFLLLSHYGYKWDVYLWDFWPLVLILIGISRLASGSSRNHCTSGIVWIVFGLFFLGRNLGLTHFHFHAVWPLIVIATGILLISESLQNKQTVQRGEPLPDGGNKLQTFWLLGGGTSRMDSKQFKGGRIASFLSEGRLDLQNADFENEVVIDVLSFLGKIDILVPIGWEVSVQGTSILGDMKDTTGETVAARSKQKPDAPKRLVIKGLAFLGDVVVSNG